MTLGEKLQSLRSEAGLSQEDLAERLAVSRQAVSKWELDKTVPDVKYIVALSDLFQVSTDYLLKGREGAPPSTAALPPEAQPDPQDAPRDSSLLVGTLLLVGDCLLFMLILAYWPLRLIFGQVWASLSLYLALFLAPIFLVAARLFLRSPASAFNRFRQAAVLCLMLFGAAGLLLAGYREVIEDLFFYRVEGAASIPILLGMSAALLLVLYGLSRLAVHVITRRLDS